MHAGGSLGESVSEAAAFTGIAPPPVALAPLVEYEQAVAFGVYAEQQHPQAWEED